MSNRIRALHSIGRVSYIGCRHCEPSNGSLGGGEALEKRRNPGDYSGPRRVVSGNLCKIIQLVVACVTNVTERSGPLKSSQRCAFAVMTRRECTAIVGALRVQWNSDIYFYEHTIASHTAKTYHTQRRPTGETLLQDARLRQPDAPMTREASQG